jgi:hypothetical protein
MGFFGQYQDTGDAALDRLLHELSVLEAAEEADEHGLLFNEVVPGKSPQVVHYRKHLAAFARVWRYCALHRGGLGGQNFDLAASRKMYRTAKQAYLRMEELERLFSEWDSELNHAFLEAWPAQGRTQ